MSREEKRRKYEKKPIQEASRISLRTQGISPHFSGLPEDYNESLKPSRYESKTPETISFAGPLYMRDAYKGAGSHRTLVDKFACLKSVQTSIDHAGIAKVDWKKSEECIDFNSFKLKVRNVARVVSENILALRFLPSTSMTMVVVGNRDGELGFWDVGHGNVGDEAIHLYRPHAAAVSGISVHPFALSKVYTTSYDGCLRLMNIEREEFDLVYSNKSGYSLYSISQPPNDPNSIYVGEGLGVVNIFDERARKYVNSWCLHEQRINTIDFNLANPNIVATGSTDGLACLWDLRKMEVKDGNCKPLHTVDLGKAVLSAYFSPYGSNLALSVDGYVRVGCMGWDDNHIYAGDSRRCINIVSVSERKIVYSLESPLMSAISSRYDAHPYTVGMMAAATAGGSVYIWTSDL
ncbi:WD repeat-containing protein 76 [Bienertia sinuspersici]